MGAIRQTIREKLAGTKPRKTRVPIAEIVGNANWEHTQGRAGINAEAVKEYQQAYIESAALPPITLFREEVTAGEYVYWIGDGFHRLRAQIKMQAVDCEAEIYEGGYLEALEWSLGANDKHGIRRTNADRRASVIMALKNPDLKKLSNRTIAGICGVDSSTVDTVIAKEFPDRIGGTKVGADGKEYDTGPKKQPAGGGTGSGNGSGAGDGEGAGGEMFGAGQGAGAGVQSGGNGALVEPEPIEEPPRTDAEGNILPEHLLQLFDTSAALEANLADLKGVGNLMRKTVKSGTTQEDAKAAALTSPLADGYAAVDKILRAAHKEIDQQVRPYAVCPYCKGRAFRLSRVADLCRKCGHRDKENGVLINRGWVTYQDYREAPEHVRESAETAEELGYWAEVDAEDRKAAGVEAAREASRLERLAKEEQAEKERYEKTRRGRAAKNGAPELPNAAPKPTRKSKKAEPAPIDFDPADVPPEENGAPQDAEVDLFETLI